jgi:hypothetical protein
MDREILKAALAPGPDCLPLEQLGRYADAALGRDEHTMAAAHIGRCANCQAELALLKAFTSGTVRPDEVEIVREGVAHLQRRAPEIARTPPVPESPRPRWLSYNWLRVAGFAAAVLLVVVAGRFYLDNATAPALPASVNTADDVTRSQTITVRSPVGELREPPRRFEWIPIAGASTYRARLMEVDRREVWSASTAATGIDLPPEVRALSVPAKTLVWDVTAYDASGGAIAESGAQAFRLAPR